MARWHEVIATALGSRHSDTIAVVRTGKRKAKKRTVRRERRRSKKSSDETREDPGTGQRQ